MPFRPEKRPTRDRRRIARALAILVLSSSCASAPTDHDAPNASLSSPTPRIIRGAPSGPEQDAVVRILTFSGDTRQGVCTGTVIAPTLVLTARHCVSIEGPGNTLRGDRAPADLDFRVGAAGAAASDDRATASAKGKRFFLPEADTIFNADFAIVELDRPLAVPPAALRLEGGVDPGEELTLVGWGATEAGTLPDKRLTRAGVKVVAVGTAASTNEYDVGSDEFRVGEGTCSGDSGGPSLSSRTGAVVGVVSRGGNGANDPNNPAVACVGANVADVHTLVPRYRKLLVDAFRATGATPRAEPTVDDPPDGGCAVARRGSGPPRLPDLLLAACAIVVARRRRPPSA